MKLKFFFKLGVLLTWVPDEHVYKKGIFNCVESTHYQSRQLLQGARDLRHELGVVSHLRFI